MTFQTNPTAQDRVNSLIQCYNRLVVEIDSMYERNVHNERLLDLEEEAGELAERIESAYAELEEGEEETYGLWPPTIEDQFAREMARFLESGTHPQYGYFGDPDEDYSQLLRRLRGIAEGKKASELPPSVDDQQLLEAARDAYNWKIDLIRRVRGGPTVPARYLRRAP